MTDTTRKRRTKRTPAAQQAAPATVDSALQDVKAWYKSRGMVGSLLALAFGAVAVGAEFLPAADVETARQSGEAGASYLAEVVQQVSALIAAISGGVGAYGRAKATTRIGKPPPAG